MMQHGLGSCANCPSLALTLRVTICLKVDHLFLDADPAFHSAHSSCRFSIGVPVESTKMSLAADALGRRSFLRNICASTRNAG
jgi:hypothetical protein